MKDLSLTDIPEEVNKPSRVRRTKVMIVRENKQILDYIVKGVTHEQIMNWVGLSEKNYWKQIAAIRKRDMELTKAEQTPDTRGTCISIQEDRREASQSGSNDYGDCRIKVSPCKR
jgi:hypothetical protein